MSTSRTLTATVLLAICLLGGTGNLGTAFASPVGNDAEPANEQRITVQNETGNERQTAGIRGAVEWAAGRFSLADLELPDGAVYFHRSRDVCRGDIGLYRSNGIGYRIDICIGGQASRERLMLHELGHAWTHHNLSDVQREAFLAMRGLESWRDADAEWDERGVEHAGEIIAWGLANECEPREMIEGEEAESLAAAFELLTRSEPLCSPKG